MLTIPHATACDTAKGTSDALFSLTNAGDVRRIKALLSDRIRRASKLPQNEMISEVVTITPAMAEYILEHHNKGNRSIRPKRVTEFAEMIKDGRYRVTSQGISFARSGVLNNGQHRLFGCVAAGVPIDVYITFGEDREAFNVLDTVSVRGVKDVLAMNGHKQTAALAGVARIIYNLERGYPSNILKLANDEAEAVVARHPGIEDAANLGHQLAKKVGGPPSGNAAAIYLIRRDTKHGLSKVDEFFARLLDGVGQQSSSPIIRLRDALLKGQAGNWTTRGNQLSVTICALIILTWNAWVGGRKRGTFTWTASEQMPDVD